MHKYILTFSKTGTICYISHLDLMKLFKRIFKRADIRLNYSQGFNPHPKMGFAQPLSLGYWSMKELLEFETDMEYSTAQLEKRLRESVPDGIGIICCQKADASQKTLAARTEAAEYMISIPLSSPVPMTGEEMENSYMGQKRIVTLKRQKKKKDLAEVDIKPMIRRILFTQGGQNLFVAALLDSGSASNLSPELVISTILQHFELSVERSKIQVMRREILFQ